MRMVWVEKMTSTEIGWGGNKTMVEMETRWRSFWWWPQGTRREPCGLGAVRLRFDQDLKLAVFRIMVNGCSAHEKRSCPGTMRTTRWSWCRLTRTWPSWNRGPRTRWAGQIYRGFVQGRFSCQDFWRDVDYCGRWEPSSGQDFWRDVHYSLSLIIVAGGSPVLVGLYGLRVSRQRCSSALPWTGRILVKVYNHFQKHIGRGKHVKFPSLYHNNAMQYESLFETGRPC